jgi:hypothetical protein
MTVRRMAPRKESSIALPYRRVPSGEDEEARSGEEEDRPFLSDDDDAGRERARRQPSSVFRKHQVLILRCLLLASCAVNAAFIGAYSYGRTLIGPRNPIFPHALYCASHLLSSEALADVETAPAQDAIAYKVQTFQSGFGTRKSIYVQPPSAEVDDAWNELYSGEPGAVGTTPIEELTPIQTSGYPAYQRPRPQSSPTRRTPSRATRGTTSPRSPSSTTFTAWYALMSRREPR